MAKVGVIPAGVLWELAIRATLDLSAPLVVIAMDVVKAGTNKTTREALRKYEKISHNVKHCPAFKRMLNTRK